MITIAEAQSLKYRDILENVHKKDSRGNPVRCRVNGKVQLWVTRPGEFKIPVKYGLYTCFYITHENASEWRKAVL